MAYIKSVITRSITGLIICSLLAAFYFLLPPLYLSLFFGVLLFIILATEWPLLCGKNQTLWYLTPLYPSLPFMLLIALNQSALYHSLIFFIFAVVFSHDTCSYLVGTLIGKHRICPSISPGKTWEGFLGGYVGTVLITLVFFKHPSYPEHWITYLALLFLFCCISFAGDLFESLLKRNAGVKDSGTLLPGHGGILDRFDSVMFVSLVVYILKNYVNLALS